MTATGRSAETTLAAVESAGFVKLLARPDGDALAAAGVLARALDARGTPFQVSVGGRARRTRHVVTADDTVTVSLGSLDDDAMETPVADEPAVRTVDPADGPLTGQAVAVAEDLGVDPDPVLALAGTVTAGNAGSDDGYEAGSIASLVEIAREEGVVERRPGVAIPTADPVDGLAHSTLVRADWSGDEAAVDDAIGDADGRQLASIVAIDAVGHADATQRAAKTIDRVVHPDVTPEGPFATVGGTADVLAAAARTTPGVAVALAIGHDVTEAALEAWRTHGRAAHAALDAAETARHDGVFVLHLDDDAPALARTDAVESVADLAAATTTPEPLVLVTGDRRLGVAIADEGPVTTRCEELADAHGLSADAGRRTATLHGDAELDVDAIVETARGSA